MRHLLALAACIALLGPAPATALAASPSPGGGGDSGDVWSRTERGAASSDLRAAEKKHAEGLKKRDNAWKHERKAAEADSADKRDEHLEKARKDYHAALERYREALDKNPQSYKVLTSTGYALRKLGEYEASLRAYDRALQLAPGYPEAIEYRAEAHLELNRLTEVQNAYRRLAVIDAEQARKLMAAIDTWLAGADARTPELPPAMLEWFREWVGRQKHAPSAAAAGASW